MCTFTSNEVAVLKNAECFDGDGLVATTMGFDDITSGDCDGDDAEYCN